MYAHASSALPAAWSKEEALAARSRCSSGERRALVGSLQVGQTEIRDVVTRAGHDGKQQF